MSAFVSKARGLRRPSEFAELAGMFSMAASGALTSLLVALDRDALWTAVPATALMVFGIMTTSRLAIVASFGLSGMAVVFATAGADLGVALLNTAAAAMILVLLVPTTDLAFTSRRRTVLHPVVVPGMIRVHVIAALAGSAWVLTIVSSLVLVAWPDAAASIAMGVLAVVSLTLAALVSRHRREVTRATANDDQAISAARIVAGPGAHPS